MDETEKYKQRLEAIAEKRRLQEEQDRARREMEDERLRLQQLKRKSLRDQWLMEGAPLSPTSLDTLTSRSPLWGFQAQEMTQDTEKLWSESQQLAEEKDKLKVQMEDDQTQKTETLAEAEKEMAQDDIVQNGENNAAVSESSEDEVKTTQSPLLHNAAISLTNGTKDLEANTNHSDSKPSAQSTTNGPVCITEGASVKFEAGLSLGVSEAEPGLTPNTGVTEEGDEETVVMRAERVIVTDEGDDVSENLSPHEGQQDTGRSEVSPLPEAEESQEEEEPVEGVSTKTEVFTQPEESEATESTMEAQPVNADDTNTTENEGGETADDGQDKPSASAAAVAPVPENQPCPFPPEAEREAAVSPEGPAAAVKVHDPAAMPGQFQEVPLNDPQENQKTEAGVGEQEPLLLQTRAQAATEAANVPASTETRSPSGAAHGEEAKAARHKTCQCCSIM